MDQRWRSIAAAIAALVMINAVVVATSDDEDAVLAADVAAVGDAVTEAPTAAAAEPTEQVTTEEPAEAATPTEQEAVNEGAAVAAQPAAVPTLADLYASVGLAIGNGPVERAGCPPPSAVGGNGGASAGEPDPLPALVAEEDLPDPAPATTWTALPDPSAGKGMWIWQYTKTEGNDPDAIVAKAVEAGLDHVWVRVGDSRNGFYGPEYLEDLLPKFHEAGIRVIGWGFPFLHDPMLDVEWSVQAVNWRTADGHGLDGFSPDIETSSEGVVLTPKRVEVYLSHLRDRVGDFPLPTTVYPPVDWVWESDYPYEQMVPYIDSFVPMDYWGCGEPGYIVRQSIQRLGDLKPVHVIGQAFGNCCAGRRNQPSPQETLRFFDVAVREGAIGASLWVWQDIDDAAWGAMASYPWADAVASHGQHPTRPEYATD